MYKNILVPIAFDSDSKSKKAIEVARALASPEAQITLLHVMEHVPGYAATYMPPDYLVQSRAAVEKELQGMAADLPKGKGLVVEGHSGRTILEYAKENGHDLIVIASHQPAMSDYLLGSTATLVVRHAHCAVHVLR
ncbi:universal stress protein [Salipiger sp. CCB-MM3]|uniref:universal stress protein n=1 Tax=Salipiger sp. CCB-MM3 TaxID=1792508 RepID=UPI00080A9DDE|nr:universal stress protein [Salipiger sp. CCB-MM3]ANT59893.1 universal stress protein [Salipiger sp. CCB-MM3]